MVNNKIYLSFDMNGNFLSLKEDSANVYAGSVSSVEYHIEFTENLTDNEKVYIVFKRTDNKVLAPLLCEREFDNKFRHLSTGEELDVDLPVLSNMTINVMIKERNVLTNLTSIKAQASVEIPVYPGCQFKPGIIEDSAVSNFEEHLNNIESKTVKRYIVNELNGADVPFEHDGYKAAPAVYVGYEHAVNYYTYDDISANNRTAKGNLYVFHDVNDDLIIQSEYLFSVNNIFSRSLKIDKNTHEAIAITDFNDITGGADGKSVYVKYATDNIGTNMQDDWQDGFGYLGTFVGYAASINPADYRWSKFIGPQGLRGERGETGGVGAKGEKGEAGVGITSVTFVRVVENGNWQYNINLTNGDSHIIEIPKGEKGERGNDGQTGATGAKGEKGENGTNGNDFTIQGYVSSTSALPQNLKTSDVGTAYLVGTETPRVVYLWGYNELKELVWSNQGYLQGPKGEKGETGQTGATGAKGDDGKNGTGIASLEYKGVDAQGNALYEFLFTDNRHFEIVIPKGKDGAAIELIDNCETDATNCALTANQGKVLNTKITTLQSNVNNIQDNISTIESAVSNNTANITKKTQVTVGGVGVGTFNADEKFDKAGGTISGDTTFQRNINVQGNIYLV